MKLTDDDIALLGAKSRGSVEELNDYFDQVVSASDCSPEHDSINVGVLAYRSRNYKLELESSDVDGLLRVMAAGDIMDRVVACLRILQLPKYVFDTTPDEGITALALAQRHLSETLVAHPVLMHNRIFVRCHPLSSAEFGPIANVIAVTQRAEFPRVAHGVSVDAIRAFALHKCVHIGLTKVAPSPALTTKSRVQGRTMMGASSVAYTTPRPGLLTSLMELDDHRAAVFPLSRRPASFLAVRGKTEIQVLNLAACTLLSSVGISAFTDSRFDSKALAAAMRTSDIIAVPKFAQCIELNLHRWVNLPVGEVTQAFTDFGHSLLAINPKGLAPEGETPTMRHVAAWMTRAILDTSEKHCKSIQVAFKNFPSVDVEKAVAVFAALDALDPSDAGTSGTAQKIASKLLDDFLGTAPDIWSAAISVHNMQQSIKYCEAERAAWRASIPELASPGGKQDLAAKHDAAQSAAVPIDGSHSYKSRSLVARRSRLV